MSPVNRRVFLQTLATVAVSQKYLRAAPISAPLAVSEGEASFKTARYAFSFKRETGNFTVSDSEGRAIFSAPLQPVVCTAPIDNPDMRLIQNGELKSMVADGSTLRLRYEGVNGSGVLSFQIRFDSECFWIDPPTFDGQGTKKDLVSLHYFATERTNHPLPGLHATYTTLPGISEGTSVSPVQSESAALEISVALGRAGFYEAPYLHQQWGLPVHYFCTSSTTTQAIDGGRANTYTAQRTHTAICGLADLPNGDLMIDLSRGRTSLWVDYRSDLWHHMPTDTKIQIGSTLVFSFGEDQRTAAVAYGEQLVRARVIERKTSSPAKRAVVFAPEFCTWGAQVTRNMVKSKLTQPFLEGLYAEMTATGMKASIFSIDDKWEGRYGNLEHDKERFPKFIEFLDTVRRGGHYIGLWTAFMRCERPEDLGLGPQHMLQGADGKPYQGGNKEYFLLDFTQPEVAKVLRERAQNFMRLYKPALVKFDFGYELPAMRTAAPSNKQISGELLLKLGLDIVIGALRDVDPDVVVMYYQLSPLFIKYFDLHSTDDLYITAGDYDLEANRRIYLGSALSSLGVAVYGSSGYDWSSSPAIWFDSVVSGTIGCLNDFKGDEFGEKPTPEHFALYNGISKAIRHDSLFQVITYPPLRPESAIRGLRAKSWARAVNGKVVMLAQRPLSFDDGDSIDHKPSDSRVANLLKTTAPVIISSLTDEALSASKRIVVVPCAAGQMSLRRQNGRHASVTTHLFGGKSTKSQTTLENGWLVLDLKRSDLDGLPVEYLEVEFE